MQRPLIRGAHTKRREYDRSPVHISRPKGHLSKFSDVISLVAVEQTVMNCQEFSMELISLRSREDVIRRGIELRQNWEITIASNEIALIPRTGAARYFFASSVLENDYEHT